MVLILPNNNAVILNGVYWLFATKFVFLSILIFKTFITPLYTLPKLGLKIILVTNLVYIWTVEL